ncbi:uncharacterized protein DUF1036 [Rhizobium subbaraonis]|uniref:Uncharacterized protein DUF1036 n=1 Tax=Rhizobium subbaraonis TaxID=908946 RepID=A0A285V1X4_9HYPH|nr:DUF1036 domain-containing protein [Rhizobium subbaraonis]SOC48165.1 uncharacterized protein DUF1036 [Rhizobium subbaraonis]
MPSRLVVGFLGLLLGVAGVEIATADDGIEEGYAKKSGISAGTEMKHFVDSAFRQLEVRENFTLNVCNKTNRDLKLAFYSKYNNLVADDEYVVMGWFDATKNSCTELTDMAKGDFAFYANNGAGREWAGKDRKLCVESARFKRVYYGENQCAKSLLKGFTDLVIDSNYHTITISR